METYIQCYRLALRHLMRQLKVKQMDLAAKAGISQAQLSRILTSPGRFGSEDARRRIAASLGTSYEDMIKLGHSLQGNHIMEEGRRLGILSEKIISGASLTANEIISKILFLDKYVPDRLRYVQSLVNEFHDAASQEMQSE